MKAQIRASRNAASTTIDDPDSLVPIEAEVAVAEAVAEAEEEDYRNVCYLLLSAGILVVAVGVVVGVVAGTNKSSSILPGTLTPTASPAILSEKMNNLLDLIGPTVTSNIELLHDPKTPQYAALQWLADIDV
jgi:hypothetical protein